MTVPVLYTPEQVAEKLQVKRRAVYAWLTSGKLRGLRAGDTWRIADPDLMAVDAVLKEQRIRRF